MPSTAPSVATGGGSTCTCTPTDVAPTRPASHLPDAIRRYVTCDGLLSSGVLHSTASPSRWGRTQHIVPDRTRRIVYPFVTPAAGSPGVDATSTSRSTTSSTGTMTARLETCNLVGLCPHHHRLHHQGQTRHHRKRRCPGRTCIFTDAHRADQSTASGARPKPPGVATTTDHWELPAPPRSTPRHEMGQLRHAARTRERQATHADRRPADIARP